MPKFRLRWLSGLMIALMALFIPGVMVSTSGEGIQLGTNVTIRFSSVELAREILTRRDDFIAALTPLDRGARMQTVHDVSEKDFLAFVGRSVRSWTPEETNRIISVLQTLGDKLDRWHLPLPATILLVRASGEILADNFVRLINRDTNVPTPQIIAAMANVFSQPTSKK